MPAQLLTATELSRVLGVSPQAVLKARNTGRLTPIDGKFDLAVAQIQWSANRKRRSAADKVAPPAGPEDAPRASEVAASNSAYWNAKTRREAAEAEIAELKAAEQRGDLVRRVVVERELASRLIALRESLEVLADRLAALVAAEPDAQACRRLLRDEHRKALAGFATAIAAVPELEEVPDGRS